MLLPTPQRLHRTADAWPIPSTLSWRVDAPPPDRDRLERRIADVAAALGSEAGGPTGERRTALRVRLVAELAAQAYRLEVSSSGVALAAGDPAGAAYGLATLAQWAREPHVAPEGGSSRELPGVVIDDAPDFAVRGVMLDISRNRVPKRQTLRELIDLFASWKINHLELYTEHTFAYRGHDRVWRGWSPLTSADVRELDAYCRERFVELVPNQNSFGHLHRWLVHEPYRALAECPDGIEHPFSRQVEPFSLCPTDPRSLELLADLYDQLLPCFESALVHVGLDETFDLGRCRSATACAERGAGRVYLDFLHAVHGLVTERSHRTVYWADMVLEHPEIVPELPRDAIAAIWGYEASYPFGELLAPFAAAGIDTWACPGTSSWNSLGGRLGNAIENVARAAVEGRLAGASGLLVTDWGDHGHLQPLPISFPGWLAAADFAWNARDAERAGELDLQAALAEHAGAAFRSPELVRALLELGDVYRLPGPLPMNASVLFQLLLRNDEPLTSRKPLRELRPAGLEAARAKLDEIAALVESAAVSGGAALVQDELRFVAGMLAVAVELGLGRIAAGADRHTRELPSPLRTKLRRRVRALGREFVRLWRLRCRPGGLADSMRFFERLSVELGGPADVTIT